MLGSLLARHSSAGRMVKLACWESCMINTSRALSLSSCWYKSYKAALAELGSNHTLMGNSRLPWMCSGCEVCVFVCCTHMLVSPTAPPTPPTPFLILPDFSRILLSLVYCCVWSNNPEMARMSQTSVAVEAWFLLAMFGLLGQILW